MYSFTIFFPSHSLDDPMATSILEPEVVPPTPVLIEVVENEPNMASQRELFAEAIDSADLGNKVCVCM